MITLQETLRGVFYAPFYAALERGAFAAQGAEIRFVSSPAPDRALDALMAGPRMSDGAGRCGSIWATGRCRGRISGASPRW